MVVSFHSYVGIESLLLLSTFEVQSLTRVDILELPTSVSRRWLPSAQQLSKTNAHPPFLPLIYTPYSILYAVSFCFHPWPCFQFRPKKSPSVQEADPELLRGKDVLEVGCMRGGGARYLMEAAEPRRLLAVDNVQEHIESCRHGGTVDPVTSMLGRIICRTNLHTHIYIYIII